MMRVPTSEKELVPFANELIEQCRVSMGSRTAYYRLMNIITETGKFDGNKSLINVLYRHIDRTAAHLFSPVELKFALDFDNEYPQNHLDRAKVVAKHLTRQWQRKNVDMLFGRGTFEAIKYGCCLLKQWPQAEGLDEQVSYYSKLVMPWQFGVYNESENDIERQPVLLETSKITLPEVWRRIWHLPGADKLYLRIKANASKNQAMAEPQSFFHQVLSTSQLNTGIDGSTRPLPGGIIALGADPNYAIMGPQVSADTVTCNELWVQDSSTGDYTTVIMIDPDVLIAPFGKKMNLTGVKGLQPYSLLQANEVTNWFWGRSELVDLAEPQVLLSTWADDMKRLFGLQVDKILAFVGDNGITDENYGQMRAAGFFNLQQGSSVTDLTPKLPPEAMQMLKFVIDTINWLSGFPDIMQGKGEPGVRAGVHASTLLKTASPTLRDRALLLERQAATAAHKTLRLREAKDPGRYWTKGESIQTMKDTEFKLTDLPGDYRVTVDSHSSSPIFADENAQLLFALRRTGDVDGEFLIDNISLPNKEEAKASLRRRQAAAAEHQQALMQKLMSNPETAEKTALKMLTGGKG